VVVAVTPTYRSSTSKELYDADYDCTVCNDVTASIRAAHGRDKTEYSHHRASDKPKDSLPHKPFTQGASRILESILKWIDIGAIRYQWRSALFAIRGCVVILSAAVCAFLHIHFDSGA
jgi:hypothetical protein